MCGNDIVTIKCLIKILAENNHSGREGLNRNIYKYLLFV